MKSQLQYIKQLSEDALAELEKTPEKDDIATLLRICDAIDDYYQLGCAESDARDNYPEGYTYDNEWYNDYFHIESSTWHELSLALRKLR